MKKKQINRINFYFIKNTIILFLIFLVVNLSLGQSSNILKIPNYHHTEDNIIQKISDFASNTLDNQLILNVLSPNNTSDATIIYFKNGNSNGVDDFDASVFPEGNPLNTKIYSYISGGKYCINALAAYSAPINISIGFEPKVDGNFTITAGEIQSFNASSSIILEDIKSNSFQDLRVNPIYNFSANTTDAINRFVLHFNFPYIWNVASGNWNTASNWNPVRTTPLNTDILVFDGSLQNTPSVILDFPSLQSIGKLKIINNANVLFSSSNTPRTINVVGTGLLSPHLRIDSLSSLTINAANTISVNVSTGNRGSISGNVTFQNASHKLMATDTSGIIFNNTSVFTAGSGFSGNPFGTTNLSSIIFASGSSYINMVDANPFGATQPNSVVKFQSGSTYKHKSIATPSLNGRVFANFELDAVGFSDNNIIGSAGVNIDNLTITNCTLIGINLTGTTNIKGNIAVSNGELSFSPATSTIINLNGTSPQTIAGSGTLTIASNAHFVVNNTVIIDKSITFGGNLTINANKTLTIISGKLLNVNGNFLIKSDATGTGSLIHSNTLIGTMERYIPIATSDDFHLLASPIVNQEINNDFNPQVQSFYAWNETNGSWLAFEDPGFGTINGGNNFLQGKGYAVSYSTTSTKNFTGVLNQGTINTNLTVTPGSYEGWNLLANPYPSAINWNIASGYSRTMLEDAGVGNYAYWIWNPTNGNYGTYISNGFFGTNGVSNFIAPAQGFWVKAISASFPFSINNNAREHASQNWLKSSTSISNTIRLNVSTTENNYTDEMIVSFGYNTDLGGAEKMFSIYHDAPSIFSNKLNKNWSINNLTSIINNTIVPVSFKAGKNGIYTINATELNSFTNATYIYLKDLSTNTLSNLNQNPNYTFSANYNDDVHRFQLIFALSSLDVSNKTIKNTNIYSNDKTIYINCNETIKQIAIYNSMGQLIKIVENSKGRIIISMNDNTSDYYIVRVICKDNVYSEKVFIK